MKDGFIMFCVFMDYFMKKFGMIYPVFSNLLAVIQCAL